MNLCEPLAYNTGKVTPEMVEEGTRNLESGLWTREELLINYSIGIRTYYRFFPPLRDFERGRTRITEVAVARNLGRAAVTPAKIVEGTRNIRAALWSRDELMAEYGISLWMYYRYFPKAIKPNSGVTPPRPETKLLSMKWG